MKHSQKQKDISFYGKMLTFSRIKLNTNNFDIIKVALQSVSPEKDSLLPVVIDTDVDIDLKKLIDLLWDWGLQPIGVVKGKLDEQAKSLRMPLFPPDGERIQRVTIKEPPTPEVTDVTKASPDDTEIDFDMIDQFPKPKSKQRRFNIPANISIEDEPTSKVASMIYDQVIRSGQSVNHVGGDLILTNSVNDGSEAITDNHLHIYGRGMGRLVAGATGDPSARIFCQKFNPSLVSVAGTYMLRESLPAEIIDKPVQVSYKEGEGLVFKIMEDRVKNITNNTINTINDR